MAKQPTLDETTRHIAERLMRMPPKPHDQMKLGNGPKSARPRKSNRGNQVYNSDAPAEGSGIDPPPKEGPLNAYIGGVVFLSKLDFHWRCELNAFEQFWTCFRETLKASGYWDGQSDLKVAATAAFQEIFSDTSELQSHIDLGLRFNAAMPKPEGLRQITLTEVIGMKLYCDLLLLKDAVKSLEKDAAAT